MTLAWAAFIEHACRNDFFEWDTAVRLPRKIEKGINISL